MQRRVSRVIIDTNLWISFLITKDPKIKRFFAASDIEQILETIDEYAEFVKVQTQIKVCRDPKDNFLLSLSDDENADILLTGDKDLLDIAKFGETTITTISNFLND